MYVCIKYVHYLPCGYILFLLSGKYQKKTPVKLAPATRLCLKIYIYIHIYSNIYTIYTIFDKRKTFVHD